ncbi:uncharacterized protein LOC121680475 [Alosa sapidissima]|uniref:uncharacterized protein LOC121680475 n=1 Tax=Alosa sapidissima TaxID=34773 RepID=UPI001C0941B7|nr:uncharacterized protein LOC121680475 [Alosa sapidissima]
MTQVHRHVVKRSVTRGPSPIRPPCTSNPQTAVLEWWIAKGPADGLCRQLNKQFKRRTASGGARRRGADCVIWTATGHDDAGENIGITLNDDRQAAGPCHPVFVWRVKLPQVLYDRQRPGETVRAFSLRCRELFQRLKDRDPDVFQETGLVLRDQFIMGLQDAELRRELNRMIRRREVTTFEQAREEALQVEGDKQTNIWQPPTCAAVRGGEPHFRARPQGDWKTELKTELLSEMRLQMKEMQQALLEELQPIRSRSEEQVAPSNRHPHVFPAQPKESQRREFKLDSPATRGQVSGVSGIGPISPQLSQVVGPCPRVDIDIEGVTVKCLLDTGSQKYQRLAAVTSVSPEDVRGNGHLALEEVSPGVVEVRIGYVSTLDPLPLHAAVHSLVQQGVELTPQQRGQVERTLQQWQDVFSLSEDDHGHTSVVCHSIPTGDAAPIRERYRPVPPTLYKEMQALLKGMLDTGVIRESSSPWAAPVVLVQKKGGGLRFCVDYRKLNSVTHKDAYPLPRIEEALTNLKKSQWYSTLDLASGYWQVEVDEQDKEKTAFATPMGLYEFQRLPFGLCNGPATFQRLMQRCLGDLNLDTVLVYLDDVIIFSPSFESHIQHLEEVFHKMRSFGLKLKPEKCTLFQKQVRFLGHLVDSEGVRPDPEKTSAVQNWKIPSTVHEVRSFLGFVGYYRRFIGGFSKIARPLNALLQNTAKHGKKKSIPVEWTLECQTAFSTLKQELTQAPVLAFADFSLPFRSPAATPFENCETRSR